MSSLLERLKAKGALPAPTNGVAAAPAPVAAPVAARVPTVVQIGAPAAAVVAPDAPDDEDDETPTPAIPASPPPSVQADKPKRTRRTKAEIEAAKAAETTQETPVAAPARQIELDAPVAAPTAAPTATRLIELNAPVSKTAAVQTRPTLYIDCIPTKGPHAGKAVMYEEWLAPLLAHICEEMNVVDVRLIDYGKGEGILAAAIRSQIADIPEAVCVTGITKFRGVFLECVTPLARDIIQKV